MIDTDSIVQEIRAQFPIFLGDEETISDEKFYETYNTSADYLTKASEPSLRAETHKLQSALTVGSVALITLILFNVQDIKINDLAVKVNRNVVLWYSFFLGAVLLSFLLRAGLDLYRANLARRKDSEKLSYLTALVQDGITTYNIESYYFYEISHLVHKSYDDYCLHMDSSSQPSHIDIRLVKLNFDVIKKIPKLQEKVDEHQAFLGKVSTTFSNAFRRFEERIEKYDAEDHQRSSLDSNDFGRRNAIRSSFEKDLKPWFDAQAELSALTSVTPDKPRELIMLEAQRKLLRKYQIIRHLYTFIEIVLPFALALIALCYALSSIPR